MVFVFLIYFIQYDNVQLYPCCCKCHYFVFLLWLSTIALCIYLLHIYIYIYIYIQFFFFFNSSVTAQNVIWSAKDGTPLRHEGGLTLKERPRQCFNYKIFTFLSQVITVSFSKVKSPFQPVVTNKHGYNSVKFQTKPSTGILR